MAKKEEVNQEMFIYAGVSVPELLLRQGKVYKKIPSLPKEFKFLKDWFIPLKDYPKFKLKNKEKLKELSKEIRKILREVK